MAKISARGARKLYALVYDTSTSEDKERGSRHELTVLLASDGRLLQKVDRVRKDYKGKPYRQSGTYSIKRRNLAASDWPKDRMIEALRPRFGDPIRTH
jgi:hypothetical protein